MKNKFPIESLATLGVDIDGLDGAVVERKGFNSDISIFPEEEKTIIATISTSDIDSDGDIVMPDGCDFSRYSKNPVVMFAHDYSKPPVGKATELKVLSNGIQAKIKFADTEMANDIWSLISGGFLKAHSIGFVTKKALKAGTKEFTDYIKSKSMKVSANCKRIVAEFTLVEDSIVPIPSNPSALTQAISAKSINISLSTAKSMGIKIDDTTCQDDEEEVMMEDKPYPSEHAFRINDPSKYNKFRRKNNEFGSGIDAIYGITDDGKAELQAIRFDASKYTMEEARAWIKDHDYKPIESSEATGKSINVVEVKEEAPVESPQPQPQPQSPPKPVYTVIRNGPYVMSDNEKQNYRNCFIEELKSVRKGKIL